MRLKKQITHVAPGRKTPRLLKTMRRQEKIGKKKHHPSSGKGFSSHYKYQKPYYVAIRLHYFMELEKAKIEYV